MACAWTLSPHSSNCWRTQPTTFSLWRSRELCSRRWRSGRRVWKWQRAETDPSSYQQGWSFDRETTVRLQLFKIRHADIFLKNRCLWADYFEAQGIQYAFFSAANAVALQVARREAAEAQVQKSGSDQNSDNEESDSDGDNSIHSPPKSPNTSHHTDGTDESESDADSEQSDHEDAYFSADEDTPEDNDPRAAMLSVLELEDLFLRLAPDLSSEWSCSFSCVCIIIFSLSLSV